MPYAAEKRQIAAIWRKLGYALPSLDTRVKRAFGVDFFAWLKDGEQIRRLLADLERREKAFDKKQGGRPCDRMAAQGAVPVGKRSPPYGHRQQRCKRLRAFGRKSWPGMRASMLFAARTRTSSGLLSIWYCPAGIRAGWRRKPRKSGRLCRAEKRRRPQARRSPRMKWFWPCNQSVVETAAGWTSAAALTVGGKQTKRRGNCM